LLIYLYSFSELEFTFVKILSSWKISFLLPKHKLICFSTELTTFLKLILRGHEYRLKHFATLIYFESCNYYNTVHLNNYMYQEIGAKYDPKTQSSLQYILSIETHKMNGSSRGRIISDFCKETSQLIALWKSFVLSTDYKSYEDTSCSIQRQMMVP
jgi:hypothetical protein